MGGSPAREEHSSFGHQRRALQCSPAADPGLWTGLDPRMTLSPVVQSPGSCQGQSEVAGGRSLTVTRLKRKDGPPIPAGCWAASPDADPGPFQARLVRARGGQAVPEPWLPPQPCGRIPHSLTAPASCQPCVWQRRLVSMTQSASKSSSEKQESAVSCILIFKPIS